MGKFLRFANGLIVLSFCIILFAIILGISKNTAIVKNGEVIWNQTAPAKLDGKWEFYWNQTVYADGTISNLKSKQLVSVPSSWTKYRGQDHEYLPVDGYGVYRIVLRAKKGQYLALKIPQIGTNYNLWVDGKIRFKNGQVGKTAKTSKPKWTTKVVNFIANNNSTEIMLEVSNFHYFRSGITTPIIVGTESQIQQIKYRGLFIDTFIFAALFVMGIFFSLLYLVNKKNKAYIFLSLFSIAIAIRPLLYGESYFNNLFPNINFEINTKIYFVSFIVIQLFFLYFYYQYEKLLNKIFVYIIGIPVLIVIIIGVILPARYMIYPVILLEAMIPIVVIICIYLLYLAYKNRSEGIAINILSILLLSFLTLVDILTNNKIIALNIYYGPIAMLIITGIQTFIQICRFRESDLLSEKLAHEISINNLKLEYEIKQRQATEKLYNGLKSMVTILSTEELVISIIDNLFQIIEFDSAILVLRANKNLYYIVTKTKAGKAKCTKYEHDIKSTFDYSFDKNAQYKKIQVQELYNLNGVEKNMILKQLYNKGRVFCTIKIVVSQSKSSIQNDLQLINIYSEQSILALQNSKAYEKIKELAMYDKLTKIYNRRYLDKIGIEGFNEATNKKWDYGVMMVDVDHFKHINDTYGHLFGDEIIRNLADTFTKSIPPRAVVGRYGGEEFLVLIKSTNHEELLSLAEKLRSSIENQSYTYENNTDVRVTISIGFVIKQKHHKNLHEVINDADKSLYFAKESGRNRVYGLFKPSI